MKKQTQTTLKHIKLWEMRSYASTSACIAEDIIAPNGTILVPKGTKLSHMGSRLDALERKLRQWDIPFVPITIREELNMASFENELKAAREKIPSIDSQFVREAVKQLKIVYERISDGTHKPEDISDLVMWGHAIAKEVARVPQLMLCLGEVRNWDEYTYIHSLNVGLLGGFLTQLLFPGKPELAESVSVGAILHDLGKARVPRSILNKPGSLTNEEFNIMKKHTIYGEELARASDVIDARVLTVIRGHHERTCGQGYPDGLKNNDIKIEARIAAVADVFDSLTTKRVYKEPMKGRAAVSMMLQSMSGHFDPLIMRALLVSVGLFPPGTEVELSDGSFGVTVGSRGSDLMRPEVLLQTDRMGRKIEDAEIIDLSKNKELYVKRSIREAEKMAF